MLKFASVGSRHTACKTLLPCMLAAVLCAGAVVPYVKLAFAQTTSKGHPELASASSPGSRKASDWRDPPAGLRGPIKNDPDHPFHGNNDGPGQVTVRIGNWQDPVLKPWAAAQMRATNEEVLSGKRQVPFTAQSRCYPGGVPGQLLYPGRAVLFHPDAEGRLDDLAARPHGAPHLPHRQALGES